MITWLWVKIRYPTWNPRTKTCGPLVIPTWECPGLLMAGNALASMAGSVTNFRTLFIYVFRWAKVRAASGRGPWPQAKRLLPPFGEFKKGAEQNMALAELQDFPNWSETKDGQPEARIDRRAPLLVLNMFHQRWHAGDVFLAPMCVLISFWHSSPRFSPHSWPGMHQG